MQRQEHTGSESVFIPPSCDPFPVPQSPKTHYFPSNTEFQSNDPQHILLTPEKPYTPSIKDNDCYSPLNYSFCEEDKKRIPEKFQVEKNQASVLSNKSSRAYVERWPSSASEKASAHTSSSRSRTNSPTISVEPLNLESNRVESISLDNSQFELHNSDFMKPKMSSTQRSSTPATNLSALVNRFRFGKPLPPEERKRINSFSNTRSRPPSGDGSSRSSMGSRQFAWQSHDVTSVSSKKSSPESKAPSTSVPSSSGKEATVSSHDDSFAELHERVERILKDSTSALNSQHSAGLSSLSSISSSKPPPSRVPTQMTSDFSTSSLQPSNLSPGELEATTPHGSLYSKTLSSSDVGSRTSFPEPNQTVPKPESQTLFPDHAVSQPTPQLRHYPEYQPGNLSPLPHEGQLPSAPANIPFKHDILQQWRLRRKMESARTASASQYHQENINVPPASDVSKNEWKTRGPEERFPPAERPFDSSPFSRIPHHPCAPPITRETRSVGISAVPGVCAQTQTSPSSSINSGDLSPAASVDIASSKRVKKDAEISLHKVTVIQGNVDPTTVPSSPPSVHSNHASTDTWSDLHWSRNNDTLSQTSTSKINEKELEAKVSSPTTTVVKQVVGARLFNETAEVSKGEPVSEECDGSFQSTSEECGSSQHASLQEETYVPTAPLQDVEGAEASSQVKSSTMKTDPQTMLNQLLHTIEHEDDDFPDDPVLASLRQQRDKYLKQLRDIEEKLKLLEQSKQFGDDDNRT